MCESVVARLSLINNLESLRWSYAQQCNLVPPPSINACDLVNNFLNRVHEVSLEVIFQKRSQDHCEELFGMAEAMLQTATQIERKTYQPLASLIFKSSSANPGDPKCSFLQEFIIRSKCGASAFAKKRELDGRAARQIQDLKECMANPEACPYPNPTDKMYAIQQTYRQLSRIGTQYQQCVQKRREQCTPRH